jgi:hypothetical protein
MIAPKSASSASSAASEQARKQKEEREEQERELGIFGVVEDSDEMLDFGDEGGMEEAFKFELEL